MVNAISVKDVHFRLPNQRPIFTGLHIGFGNCRTGIFGRNGVGKSTLLKLIRGEYSPTAGSISVVGTTAMLRQRVQVDDHWTIADAFGVSAEIATLRRIEQGVGTDADLSNADWTLETRIASALGRLGLTFEAERCLADISGGQRTRVGIAALVFADADFLLLDEPTINLDRDGRQKVLDLLCSWRAGALVVSHDRELLELMDSIVELTSLGARTYGGNWGEYQAQKSLELSAAARALVEAEKCDAHLHKITQQKVERQSRRNRAGKQSASQGGVPRISLGARKQRSELTTAGQMQEAARLQAQVNQKLRDAHQKIEVVEPFRVEIPSTNLHPSKTILTINDLTFGYEPARPVVHDFSLTITGPKRISIQGQNGAGKTTLIALIAGTLQPWSGSVRRRSKLVFLDQSVGILDRNGSVRDNYLRINPWSTENECRAALARFKFRSDAALQIASTLSGGELLRAGLACVLAGPTPPPLLILDEPTDHLDLESIETVERGLVSYDGAMIVVSHDTSFLKAISITREVVLGEG